MAVSVNYTEWAKSSYAPVGSTRAVWKVRGLTFLLRVGTLLRCGDGLFFEAPPLARDALLTTFYPLLENVLQTVHHFEMSCLETLFSWLEKPRNLMGRDLNWILSAWKVDWWKPITTSAIQSRSRPMRFVGFYNHEKEFRGEKFRSDQRSSTRFREEGGAL
jgi:hypothetical protein